MNMGNEQAALDSSDRATQPERVLIVDDEPLTCDICARALREVGYEVFATIDVSEALRCLHGSYHPDLIVTDIEMPRMSGLELAEHAREIDPTVAVVIITGHASVTYLHEAVRRGAADVLVKPFGASELRLAVEQALHKRKLIQNQLRAEVLEELLTSSEAINASLDGTLIAQTILSRSMVHAQAEAALLIDVDDLDEIIKTVTAQPNDWRLLAAGRSALHEARNANAPVLIESDAPLCTNGTRQLRRGVIVPLSAPDRLLALMLLADDRPDRLTPADPESVAVLASQAGMALNNARLYRELQKAYQSLQELDRLKSEFIAIASHELRTPLSVMLGYTMMMREQSKEPNREIVDRVLNSVRQIKEIVDDMVGLRHIEERRVTLFAEPYRVEDLFAYLKERFEAVARSREQSLTVTANGEIAPFLVDREKMLLAVSNLVANALKFTPEHGKVTVVAEVWSAEQLLQATEHTVVNTTFHNRNKAEHWAVIQVADTGIGIDRRHQARIFDRFFQAADSLTREHGGLGLGLSLVHDLIDLQGGVVWVESIVDEGSVLSCALPYTPQVPDVTDERKS